MNVLKSKWQLGVSYTLMNELAYQLNISHMKQSLSSLKIISDIISMRNFAQKLLGKEYDPLLIQILSYNKDGRTTPHSIKSLQEKMKMKYDLIRKQLNCIYNDLLDHEGIDFSIKKVEYEFCLYHFNKYASFILDNIPVLPRIGDQIDFPFLKAEVGTTNFYVYSIEHNFESDKQCISITLRSGFYNKFLDLKKEEEYLKGRLSFDEYLTLNDFELKERFGYPKYH